MSTQSNVTDKQNVILQTALKLFVKHGFHGTPTSRIAAEAGIAHGTIFHYYKTKDELVEALYGYVKAHLQRYLHEHVREKENIKEKFKALFFHSVQWSLQYREEFLFTQQFQYSPHMQQSAAVEAAKQGGPHMELYQEALRTKVFKPMPADLISELSKTQMIGVYNYLSKAELSKAKTKQLIEQVFELTWKMFANQR